MNKNTVFQKQDTLPKHNTFQFLLFLSLIFPFSLNSQDFKKNVSPETLRLIKENANSDSVGTGVVILLKESYLTIDKYGKKTEVFHIIGKILDQKGRLDFAQIPLIFNSYYEELTVDFARSISRDGKSSEVYPDAIIIQSLPQTGGGIRYSDYKALSFSLPGLDVGVAFEFQVTIKEIKQVIDGEWFMNHMFGYILRNLLPPYLPRLDPVVKSRLVVRVPSGKKFLWYMRIDSTAPLKTITKSYDEYCWELKAIKDVKIEGGMPPLDDLSPTIMLSSLKSWKQIDHWISKKYVSADHITPAIRKKVTNVLEGATTKEEKIARLFHLIQRDIKYVSADLDRSGYAPHRSEDVLNNRYGDCKDQAMLFVTLLNIAGIEAYPALINPMPYPEIIEIPVPYFSHVITYIPNGLNGSKDLWLDTTPGVTAFPNVYAYNQNRFSFVMDGQGGRMIKTPGSTAEENEYSFNFSVTRNGVRADVIAEFYGKGAANDGLKQMFQSMNTEESKKQFQSLIVFQYKKAVFDSLQLSNIQNPEDPFKAVVYFHLDDMWKEKLNRFTYGSNTRLALDFFNNQAQYPHPDTRYNSIHFSFPFSISGVELFARPSFEFSKESIPPDDNFETKFLRFERSFNTISSGISARWKITYKQPNISLKDYKAFYQDIDRMKSISDWAVTFFTPMGTNLSR